ncbi:uncharacterized protein LOC124369883 [Homalodisca vitripennis]|uniref:uncharacterized protein LOC124369883 n=1 Tax=Homalodisca vitripennis TaxID=197043 RepID=UPI001EEA2BD9|nr:uncharacterized protein LOC124369883 [Homalodisca vitripennis]XP_046683978.1 uncharacterized protein LOC124369883 [Homalodisca vitripennis]
MELFWIIIFFTTICDSGVLSEVGDDYDQDNEDNADLCLPQLADRCFKDVMPSIVCQLENKGSCDELSDFCSVLADSLQCAADIIDTDCKPEEGRNNFDSWLSGLNAVYAKICDGSDGLLRVLLESPCFNSDEFLECVEEMTQVTHVVDLLQVILNTNECNRLLIALPTCNVRANAAHSRCYMPQEVINSIIYTFFSHTQCGESCTKRTTVSHATVIQSPTKLAALSLTLIPFVHRL